MSGAAGPACCQLCATGHLGIVLRESCPPRPPAPTPAYSCDGPLTPPARPLSLLHHCSNFLVSESQYPYSSSGSTSAGACRLELLAGVPGNSKLRLSSAGGDPGRLLKGAAPGGFGGFGPIAPKSVASLRAVRLTFFWYCRTCTAGSHASLMAACPHALGVAATRLHSQR